MARAVVAARGARRARVRVPGRTRLRAEWLELAAWADLKTMGEPREWAVRMPEALREWVEVVADCRKTRFAGNRPEARCVVTGSRVVIRAGFPVATGNARRHVIRIRLRASTVACSSRKTLPRFSFTAFCSRTNETFYLLQNSSFAAPNRVLA